MTKIQLALGPIILKAFLEFMDFIGLGGLGLVKSFNPRIPSYILENSNFE